MRWTPLHPRQVMTMTLAMLVFMAFLMLAAAPDLGTLDLSLGSGSNSSDAAPALAAPPADPAATPAWTTDPFAPRLEALLPR